MIDEVQGNINQISPILGFLDKVGGRADEEFAEFSLGAARDAAWLVARRFVSMPSEKKDNEIEQLDKSVSTYANLIVQPDFLVQVAI